MSHFSPLKNKYYILILEYKYININSKQLYYETRQRKCIVSKKSRYKV